MNELLFSVFFRVSAFANSPHEFFVWVHVLSLRASFSCECMCQVLIAWHPWDASVRQHTACTYVRKYIQNHLQTQIYADLTGESMYVCMYVVLSYIHECRRAQNCLSSLCKLFTLVQAFNLHKKACIIVHVCMHIYINVCAFRWIYTCMCIRISWYVYCIYACI